MRADSVTTEDNGITSLVKYDAV